MKMRDFTYNIIDRIVVALDEGGNDGGIMPLEGRRGIRERTNA